MISDENGAFVGILHMVDYDAGFHSIGPITPFAAIQDDVKELTGGGYLESLCAGISCVLH